MYSPKFRYTHMSVKNLLSIERARVVVDMLPLPADVERKLRDRAKLSMAHYSTRIEGNPLDYSEAQKAILGRKDRRGAKAEQEVRNYWDALTFLATSKKLRIPITENFIKRLHSIIEVRSIGRRHKESQYRGAMPPGLLFAVYDNISKQPEYIPPEYNDVPILMADYIKWINSDDAYQLPAPVKAAIATYQLVTIHPFEDGNGRTARAIATYVLSTDGYDLKGFNSMEEYYVEDLQGYYENLQMKLPPLYYDGRNNPDLSPWIDYFTTIMAKGFQRIAVLAQAQYQEQIHPRVRNLDPKEKIVLKLLLLKGGEITPKDIGDEFKSVNSRTITKWAQTWMEKGVLEAASGKKRIRSYRIGQEYANVNLEDLGFFRE